MKEKEFNKKLGKLCSNDSLIIPVYYGLDENEDVLIDFDSMTEEFNYKLREIEELLKEKDELTDIVAEKIDKINSDRNKIKG